MPTTGWVHKKPEAVCMLINKRRYKNHRPLSFQGKLCVTLMEPLGFDGGILISGSPCGHVSQFRFNKTPACALKAAFRRPLRCWTDYGMEEMSFGCRFQHLPIRLPAPAIWLRAGLFSFITHFREASTPWALFRKSIRNVTCCLHSQGHRPSPIHPVAGSLL